MELDFVHARKTAFEYLSKTNSLFVLTLSQQRELSLSSFAEVWNVKAEFFLPEKSIKEITLHVCLPNEFPLVLPKIYLAPSDNKWIQYIPHVDTKGYICTLDDEFVSLDADQPGAIVKIILDKALTILEDGLAKKNVADFAEEFIAYWEEKYGKKDEVHCGMSIIEHNFLPPANTIKFLHLSQSYAGYSIIIHHESPEFLQLKKYLKERKFSFDELESFYLGELNSLLPPFNATNTSILDIIQTHFPDLSTRFGNFINTNSYPKVVLFSTIQSERRMYFGWRIHRLNTNRNGFRPTTLSPINVMDSFQKNDPADRIKFDQFTSERLIERSEGIASLNTKLKIGIAGLGSIGSNLIPYLLPLGIEKLLLVDPDILTLENTPRHLLGVDAIPQYKTDAIKIFLEDSNPFINITAIRKSIVNVVINDPTSINECDYLFVAIGKTTIEEYLSNALKENKICKPLFILWVEPFLIGAHCIFIQPGHNISFKGLFLDGFFKYNIISEAEYKDPLREFTFKEAGCQSTYVPYGMKSIVLFLSALIPEIYSLIENKSTQNLHISWRGPGLLLKDMNIKLSEFGNQIKENTIAINDLEWK